MDRFPAACWCAKGGSSVTSDTPPPHDSPAERAVLGACLVHPDHIARVAAILQPGDWWGEHHARIWKAIRHVHATGGAVDLVTVRDALGDDLDTVGGPAYVTSLTDGMPKSAHVASYAGIVRRCALQRRLAAAQAAQQWAAVVRIAAELEAPAKADAEDGPPWIPVSEAAADAGWTAHASGVAFPGRMTLFSGHRKQGKSTLIAAVAAGVADGADWLTGEEIDAGWVFR